MKNTLLHNKSLSVSVGCMVLAESNVESSITLSKFKSGVLIKLTNSKPTSFIYFVKLKYGLKSFQQSFFWNHKCKRNTMTPAVHSFVLSISQTKMHG